MGEGREEGSEGPHSPAAPSDAAEGRAVMASLRSAGKRGWGLGESDAQWVRRVGAAMSGVYGSGSRHVGCV